MSPERRITPVVRAAELLEALGATRQQVAKTLFDSEDYGHRGSCGRCPVAVHLERQLGVAVSVGDLEVSLHLGPNRLLNVDLPDPVVQFVAYFDLGEYPLLDLDLPIARGETGWGIAAAVTA
jgi:hypothetical protein